jgi:hypothetical protein
MLNQEENDNIKQNIYHFLIDYQELRSLAIETFENIDSFQTGYLTLKQVQLFIKTLLDKINQSDLLSNIQIQNMFEGCVKEAETKMSVEKFVLLLQVFLEVLYELYDYRNSYTQN